MNIYFKPVLSLYISCLVLLSGWCLGKNSNALQNIKPEFLPIVMIHGVLASGDTYAKHSMLFGSNNYDTGLLFAFDWNSFNSDSKTALDSLDAFIDKVLTKTNQTQVYLIGHSAGGELGYTYCTQDKRASKIKKYVHLASSRKTKPAGPNGEIPTLNIFSKGDNIVPGNNLPGGINAVFDDLDHFQVATSEKSFEKIFNFLLDGKIANLQITKKESSEISGRLVTLAENKPVSGIVVFVYQVDETTGNRIGNAVTTFSPDKEGSYGPIKLNPACFHEFEITSSDPDFRPLHYYREPFIRDNKFVYLRTFPPVSSFAGLLLSGLPKDDNQSVVTIFSANQSIIHGRDNLKVQNIELSNATLCSAQNSTIAMFLYDDGDAISSGKGHLSFSKVPFLKAADIYNGTNSSETISITFNGRTRGVKNLKSETEGVVIVVFD